MITIPLPPLRRMDTKLALIILLTGLLPVLIAGALTLVRADHSLRKQVTLQLPKARKLPDRAQGRRHRALQQPLVGRRT